MLASQRDCMTLQLFDAEQLSAQQLDILVVTQRISCARRKSELFDSYSNLLARTRGAVPRWPCGLCVPKTFTAYVQVFSQLSIDCGSFMLSSRYCCQQGEIVSRNFPSRFICVCHKSSVSQIKMGAAQNGAFAFNVSIRKNKTAAQAVLLRHVWGGRWARTHDNRNHNPKMQLIKKSIIQ